MKIILQGLEDSGKSLRLAMICADLVDRNHKWYKKQVIDYKKMGAIAFQKKYDIDKPIPRTIHSNLRFSDSFFDYAKKKGVPIEYWQSIDQVTGKDDCDIIIDEVGRYFDARKFAELSNDARRWLTQSSKRGVEIYGAAQDFSQVDVYFRRLVGGRGGLFHIRKLMGSRRPSPTKPPVKRIWGVCALNELDPIGYDSDKSQFKPKSLLPRFFFIERKYCEIFDTRQKIVVGTVPPLRHVEHRCELPNCEFKRIAHVA